MKISQGDTVAIIAGKDKGKTGTVLRILKTDQRVIVSGINMMTKHVKKTAQGPGKKIRFEHSIHASNVMVVDPKTKKPTRVGYSVDEKTGKKVRIAKKSGSPLERTKLTKEQLKSIEPKKSGASFKTDGVSTSEPDNHASAPASHPSIATFTRPTGRGS